MKLHTVFFSGVQNSEVPSTKNRGGKIRVLQAPDTTKQRVSSSELLHQHSNTHNVMRSLCASTLACPWRASTLQQKRDYCISDSTVPFPQQLPLSCPLNSREQTNKPETQHSSTWLTHWLTTALDAVTSPPRHSSRLFAETMRFGLRWEGSKRQPRQNVADRGLP